MVKKHCLLILLRDVAEDLVLHVDEAESERLRSRLAMHDVTEPGGFHGCETVEGRSYILNLAYVQGVRFLWDVDYAKVVAAENGSGAANDEIAPEEGGEEEDYGPMLIKFRDRAEPLDVGLPDADDAYTLFWQLELDSDINPTFIDADGEPFFLVASEIQWIEAAAGLLEEGRRIVEAEAAR